MKKKRIAMPDNVNQIKVRLDNRTIITIKDIGKLGSWLLKYPDAKVIA